MLNQHQIIPGKKFLLCRPEGGLNDLLSQIELSCRYAEVTRRAVIVDGAYRGATSFHDDFSEYFVARRASLQLNATELNRHAEFTEKDIYPAFVGIPPHTYTAEWSTEKSQFVDAETGRELKLDLKRVYPHKLVLHHACGAVNFSHMIFLRLHLREFLVDQIRSRLEQFEKPYVAIHIRNTDYKTDYRSQLQEIKQKLAGPVFIATDNFDTLNDCREILGANNVVSFSNIPQKQGRPLHLHLSSADDIRQLNSDAILDLFTLALAKHLVIFKVENNRFSPYSGYSMLAKQLNQNKCLLSMALGDPESGFSRHLRYI